MTPNKSFQKLRMFVASPVDVSAERSRLTSVVEALNRGLADHFGLVLEIKDWYGVVPDMGRAEEVLLKEIPVSSWDIFIGILWLRFGTPSGGIDPVTNKAFLSGTEEEFRLAYQSWVQNRAPRILFYRCVRPPASMVNFDFSQAERVKHFFDEFDATTGKSPGLYRNFETVDDFERLVREHLEKFVMEYADKVQGSFVSPDIRRAYTPETTSMLPRRESFFGRKEEIAQALRALSQEDRGWGLIIDGIGGIGKSALAVEVAHLCKDSGLFEAFIFVTAKADRLTPEGIQRMHHPVATLDGLINEVARGLGLSSITQLTDSKAKQDALRNALSNRRALIIFDNAETLPIGDQISIGDFLRYLPQGCKAIITSRRRGGEAAVTLRLEKLKIEEAWELVQNQMEKYGDVRRALTFSGPDAWKELYYETGGSPLALLWTLGLINARGWTLARGIQMLREGGGAGSDLNEFIYGAARKTMDVSEILTLGAVSLFGGPASFEAVAATTDLDRHTLDAALERLRAMSLIDLGEQSETQGHAEERYALHPLTKRFARADLEADSELALTVGRRFVRYWTNYAMQFGGSTDESYKAYEKLEAEWVNLDAAAKWLWEHAAERENAPGDRDAARMLNSLAELLKTFLLFSGRWDERRQLNAWAYAAACSLNEWQNAGWHAYHIAFDNYNCRRTPEAELWLNRCAEAWTRVRSVPEQAEISKLRGLLAKQRGKYEEAGHHIRQAIALGRALNRERFLSSSLNDLGDLHYQNHEVEAARRCYEEALELAERASYKVGQATIGGNLGLVLINLRKWAEARKLFEQELAIAREIGRIDLASAAQCGLARVFEWEGRPDLALPLAQQALSVYERLQHRRLEEARQLVERLKARAKNHIQD